MLLFYEYYYYYYCHSSPSQNPRKRFPTWFVVLRFLLPITRPVAHPRTPCVCFLILWNYLKVPLDSQPRSRTVRLNLIVSQTSQLVLLAALTHLHICVSLSVTNPNPPFVKHWTSSLANCALWHMQHPFQHTADSDNIRSRKENRCIHKSEASVSAEM